jgi:hypothetical protein
MVCDNQGSGNFRLTIPIFDGDKKAEKGKSLFAFCVCTT